MSYKLNTNQIAEIRDSLSKRLHSKEELATLYDVSIATIARVHNGKIDKTNPIKQSVPDVRGGTYSKYEGFLPASYDVPEVKKILKPLSNKAGAKKKLSTTEVAEIKQLLEKKVPTRKIAEKYDVSTSSEPKVNVEDTVNVEKCKSIIQELPVMPAQASLEYIAHMQRVLIYVLLSLNVTYLILGITYVLFSK